MLKRNSDYTMTVFRLTPEGKARLDKMAAVSHFCQAELMRAALFSLEKEAFHDGKPDFNVLTPLVIRGNGVTEEK